MDAKERLSHYRGFVYEKGGDYKEGRSEGDRDRLEAG